jgi:hypothetical protein
MSIEPGLYRHYKAKNYRVIGNATHSETEEAMVIYHVDDQPSRLWVRPAKMWNDLVRVGGEDVVRFQRISD